MPNTLVHGLNPVVEAMQAPGRVTRLYVAKGAKHARVRDLVDEAKKARIPFDIVPLAKLNAITGTGEHQGVAAAVSPVEFIPLDDCLAACGSNALLLVLDRVQHPKNLGMLIRTAAAAGASGIIFPSKNAAHIDESVLRASAGTVFRIPLVRVHNLSQALRQMQEAGFWVYGLSGEASHCVFSVPWSEKAAILAGNESDGLRHGVRKHCDMLVSVPMAQGVESLNVTVAAGIALFQAANTMHLLGDSWRGRPINRSGA